jgi:hypothetical protein
MLFVVDTTDADGLDSVETSGDAETEGSGAGDVPPRAQRAAAMMTARRRMPRPMLLYTFMRL